MNTNILNSNKAKNAINGMSEEATRIIENFQKSQEWSYAKKAGVFGVAALGVAGSIASIYGVARQEKLI